MSRNSGATIDFDVEIAKKKSLDEPVFHVQYGHARLSSIPHASRSGFLALAQAQREPLAVHGAEDQLSPKVPLAAERVDRILAERDLGRLTQGGA